MSLETLLQAAKYVEYHSEAKARGEEPHDYDTYMRLVSTAGQPSIVDDHDYNDVEADNLFKSNNNNVSGGSGDSDAKERRRAGGAGTREVHNKLEKNRRAHLKECFDTLRRQLPNMDDKKTSNLSILRGALRYAQTLKRKEREYENELERLAQEKIKLQRKLARTKKQYCSHLEQSAATFDDHNRPEQHEVDNDTNSTSTASECGPPSDIEDETTAINNSSPRFTESTTTDSTAAHQDMPTERPSPYIPQFTQMVVCSPATVASSTTSTSAHPTVADGFTNKKPTVTIAKAQSGNSQLMEHHHARVLPPTALAHAPSQTSGHKPGTLGMNGVSAERFTASVQNADVKGPKQPIFISKFKNAMQAPSNNSSNKLSNNIVNCAIDSAMLANTNKIARLGVKPGTGVAVPTALAFPAGTLTLTTSATSGSSSVSTSRQVITATVKSVARVHPPLAQIAHVMTPPSIVTTMGPLVMPHLNHTMAHVIGHQQQLSKVVATTQGSVIKSVGVTQIPIVQQQFLSHHHQHIQPQPMVKPVVVVSSPSVVMAQNSNQTSHVQVTLPGR